MANSLFPSANALMSSLGAEGGTCSGCPSRVEHATPVANRPSTESTSAFRTNRFMASPREMVQLPPAYSESSQHFWLGKRILPPLVNRERQPKRVNKVRARRIAGTAEHRTVGLWCHAENAGGRRGSRIE